MEEQGNAVGTRSWSSCVYQTDLLDGVCSGWQTMIWVFLLWFIPLQLQVCDIRAAESVLFVAGMRPWAGFRSHLASPDGGGGAVCQTFWAAIPRAQSSLRVLISVGDRVAYIAQCKQVLPQDTVGLAAKAFGRCAHT